MITKREIVQEMTCSVGLRQRRVQRSRAPAHTALLNVSMTADSSLLLLSGKGTGHVCEETRPQFHDSLRSMELLSVWLVHVFCVTVSECSFGCVD